MDTYVRMTYGTTTSLQFQQIFNLYKTFSFSGTQTMMGSYDSSILQTSLEMGGTNPLPDIQSLKSSISITLLLAPLGGSEQTIPITSALIRTKNDIAIPISVQAVI